MYNPQAKNATEFIDHQEIVDTLTYADSNCNNRLLAQQVLAKARLRGGLTHREASLLLACEAPDLIEEIYALASEIKQQIYGNRIVMFAPLYLSNYCVNGCVYCPYHLRIKPFIAKNFRNRRL